MSGPFVLPSHERDADSLKIVQVGDAAFPEFSDQTIRLWRALSPLDVNRRRSLLASGSISTGAVGESVDTSGEVALLVSGSLVIQPGKGALCGEILGPGDVLNLGTHQAAGARWITPGEIYRTAFDRWVEAGGDDGLWRLLAATEKRRRALEARVICLTRHGSTLRVADFLDAVRDRTGAATINLSQQALGDLLGLRRTTVNASCRELETAGAIHTVRGRIRLIGPRVLADFACGCSRSAPLSATADPRIGTELRVACRPLEFEAVGKAT